MYNSDLKSFECTCIITIPVIRHIDQGTSEIVGRQDELRTIIVVAPNAEFAELIIKSEYESYKVKNIKVEKYHNKIIMLCTESFKHC